ncbi:MAG: polysaccharide transporter, partial [Bacilli bacterium]|nr:polysaccharide transporter [Bacilli bacterium]
MRTKNSIKNTIVSFSSNLLTIVIGLIAQAIFIKILGSEYLGINGLFSNIISMLGIVELGVGSAIIYHLYKPIAEEDIKKVKALMNFYKKCYTIIALIILTIGLMITPYLNLFIEEVTIDINISLVYILFIIEIVCSYLLSYKRSIINANQKNYLVNFIHIGYLVILNILEIIILVLTKNYYLYLGIKIGMRILENVGVTLLANKLYPYLKNNNEKLDENTKKDIFQKVKALFFHKIGGFIVLGTDNIIISKFIGIIEVGLYSNYYMIIDAVEKLFGQVIKVITPSVGNMLVKESSEKSFEIFKRVRFLNFWIATFSGISLLVVMNSFITVWIGSKYLLATCVLIVLVLNYYAKSMRSCHMIFKEAAGIYYEDRYIPLLESVLNIVASLILLKYFGLAGIFMGTIISSLALYCISYPKYVYKKLFNRSYLNYTKETLGYLSIFLVLAVITFKISRLIVINNAF